MTMKTLIVLFLATLARSALHILAADGLFAPDGT